MDHVTGNASSQTIICLLIVLLLIAIYTPCEDGVVRGHGFRFVAPWTPLAGHRT